MAPYPAPTDSDIANTNYSTWNWKQVMYALFGTTAYDNTSIENSVTGVSVPQSLWDAATYFDNAATALNDSSTQISDWAKNIVGVDGVWTGDSANALQSLVTQVTQTLDGYAQPIQGTNGFYNNLINNGTVLQTTLNKVLAANEKAANDAVTRWNNAVSVADTRYGDPSSGPSTEDSPWSMASDGTKVVAISTYPDIQSEFDNAAREAITTLAHTYSAQSYTGPTIDTQTSNNDPFNTLNQNQQQTNDALNNLAKNQKSIGNDIGNLGNNLGNLGNLGNGSGQPNLNVPNLNQPNLKTPNLSTPNITAPNIPGVHSPNLNTPDLNAPNLSTPNITAPNIPGVNSPDLNAPNLTTPNLNTPNLSTPNITAPNIPGVNSPNLSTPNLNTPNITAPNIPGVNSPDLSGMTGLHAGPNGQIVDSLGNPALGPDGKPLTLGPDGTVLDSNGKPVLGPDGKALKLGPNGQIVDSQGNPVNPQDPSDPLVPQPVLTEPNLTEPTITEPNLTEPQFTEPNLSMPKLSAPNISAGPLGLGNPGLLGSALGAVGGRSGPSRLSSPELDDLNGEKLSLPGGGSIQAPVSNGVIRAGDGPPPKVAGAEEGAGAEAAAGEGSEMPYMPMGGMGAGMGGGQQQNGEEHNTWLQEDEDVWGTSPDVGIAFLDGRIAG